MLGDLVDTGEGVVDPRSASITELHAGNVSGPELTRRLGDAYFVPDQDDLDAGSERGPAADGVPLDDADVTLECLRDREERQHCQRASRKECTSPSTGIAATIRRPCRTASSSSWLDVTVERYVR